jgi:hypothetical protein
VGDFKKRNKIFHNFPASFIFDEINEEFLREFNNFKGRECEELVEEVNRVDDILFLFHLHGLPNN